MLQWIMMISVCLSFWTSPWGITTSSLEPRLTLTYENKQWILPLHQVGFDGIDPTTLDRSAVFHWIHDQVEKDINRPPRSAFFREGKLIPHQFGRKVNRRKIDDMLDQIHFYLNKPQTVPVIYTQPQLTTKQCQRLTEKHLASYTTLFQAGNVNRAHNIYLSAKAINDHIVLPGQIFSFNKVVGQRTTRKGYKRAKIIVKGEYSEGIGGGICQTSSTLYNSVDQAGLEIIERISHSRKVPYVPQKRDATVSWGGPDFRFKNQLNEPIMITTHVKGGRITVSIYGPDTILNKPKKNHKKNKSS